MSRFNKTDVAKKVTVLAGSLLAVLAAGSYLVAVTQIDPFAGLKRTSKTVDPNLGVRIEGVELKSFKDKKLVTKANIDRMDIGQSRQQYELFGVHDGIFISKKGKLQFDAERAIWNVPAHDLQAPFGGHVKGKDADLHVPQFAFNSETGVLNTPGEVKGKLMKGDVRAMGLKYNINDETFSTGPAEWKGKLAINFQDGDKNDPRMWDLKAPGGFSYEKDGNDTVLVYKQGYGTDGTIIVSADVIKHNRRTDVVTAIGHVLYVSRKVNMNCDKAVIERQIKKATLTGNVQMLFKPKDRQTEISVSEQVPPFRPIVPDEIARSRPPAPGEHGQTPEQKKFIDQIRSSKNARDYPTICYAEKVEYWYKDGDRHAIITGNPQARQDLPDGGWRQIWTKSADYNGETDRLMLHSSGPEGWETRMINSIGDDFQSEWIEVSTKEDDDFIQGGSTKGRWVDYNDSVPRDKSDGNTGKTQPPPKTGGDLKGGIGGGRDNKGGKE